MRRNPLLSSLGTVRARLILGNVLVLGIILLVLGSILRFTVNASIAAMVDQDLTQRAGRFVRRWPPSQREDTAPEPQRQTSSRELADVSPPMQDIQPDNAGPNASNVENRPAYRFKVLDLRERVFFTGSQDRAWDRAAFLRATRGASDFSTVYWNRELMRVYSTPLRRDGEIEGVLQVARPLTEIRRQQERISRTLLTMLPLALLAAALGGFYVTARVLRPVRVITHTASGIEAQNLSERLPVQGQDEFSELAATFNGMLARLEKSFAQQRRFTADASHELRSPLTVILGESSQALSAQQRSPDEYRQALESVRHAASRMSRIVRDLLFLARYDADQLPTTKQPLPVRAILEDAAESLPSEEHAPSPPPLPIRLDVPDDSAAEVFGDADHLVRLFTNLLGNAARHTPPDGSITVRAYPQGEMMVITVSDTGEGIAPEHLPHLFDRFYRVDGGRARAQGGTGLGLAIAKSIVEAHGGTIGIESVPGKGTTVTVTLPRSGVLPADASAP